MSIVDYLKDRRIATVLVIVVALLVLDLVYGGPQFLHFGIEFVGGTQIPVTLEHSVTPDQMSDLLSVLQERVSTFGLKQVSIEGIGSSEVYVTIPSVSGAEINSTINLIQSQGVFQALVNGVEALNGTSILSGSIGAAQPTVVGQNVSWSVDFYLTQTAAERFAKAVFGQAYQPLYMFIDRPTGAIVLLNESTLRSAVAGIPRTSSITVATQAQALGAIQNASSFGRATIPIEIINDNASNWKFLYAYFASHNTTYNRVILQQGMPSFITNALQQLNYTLSYQTAANMTPQIFMYQTSTVALTPVVASWPAIGLLSAPSLEPGVTNGSIGVSYVIAGVSPLNLTVQQKLVFAQNQSKKVASILTGGSLPVKVIVGDPVTTPPTLGTKSLIVSAVAAMLAVLAVAFVIVARYRRLFLIVPIILTFLAELFMIVSVIGLLGTIDLAAVAGMIAVVGTGVDAQIIITDEVLAGSSEAEIKFRLRDAFYIIWISAILLIVAMLPLLFSTSLISVIGFAESTILGALLGVFITRPAYGAIVSKHYSKSGRHA
jgi:preprotein translocase subunit SecD